MIWKTLNELINKPKKNTNVSKTFVEACSTNAINNPKEIADKFNEYFINIGPNLANKIKCNENDNFQNYLIGNYESMFLNPITEFELEKEIQNMNSNKCSGYDCINTKVIQLSAKEISMPLTHIFNLTFLTGVIPDDLKIALVTPIFKGNDEQKFQNYRPISVLTCFSKLLEKHMAKRLNSFIITNNILTKHQYGFRKNRSTELAIIDFVDKITKAIDEGKTQSAFFFVGDCLPLCFAQQLTNHKSRWVYKDLIKSSQVTLTLDM